MLIISGIACCALAMLVHEFGHLVAARNSQVKVSELGLGLGPKLFSFTIGTIVFSLRAIPLGSFVRLDGLPQRSLREQLNVHLGGIAFNLVAGVLFYGTLFGWINLLIAAGNLLPLYQHDGWKCGVLLMRALLRRQSQRVEWAFTFSGGFVSLLLAVMLVRLLG